MATYKTGGAKLRQERAAYRRDFAFRAVMAKLFESDPEPQEELSYEEFDVLKLLAQGHDPRAIGRRFQKSKATIDRRTTSMADKFGLNGHGRVSQSIRLGYKLSYLPPYDRQPVSEGSRPTSPRRRELLWWAANGLPNREISEAMGVDYSTTTTQAMQAIRDLRAQNRAEAIAVGIESGQVPTMSIAELNRWVLGGILVEKHFATNQPKPSVN